MCRMCPDTTAAISAARISATARTAGATHACAGLSASGTLACSTRNTTAWLAAVSATPSSQALGGIRQIPTWAASMK